MDEDWKTLLDQFDDASVRRALIEALREDGGERFRSLVHSCVQRGDRELYERLISIPELHDLVPH
jgi:hypothetical protein